MLQPKFKIGDVVQLNSGGPAMTINEIIESEDKVSYRCQWFVKDILKNGVFIEDSIGEYDLPLLFSV